MAGKWFLVHHAERPKGNDMSRQMHLNKSGSGFTSRTACGRNILRTPMSTDWENFKMEAAAYRCIKCVTSKQFEVNTKMDARKAAA
jgi:hypothetical protein